jgi:hypothetical protein
LFFKIPPIQKNVYTYRKEEKERKMGNNNARMENDVRGPQVTRVTGYTPSEIVVSCLPAPVDADLIFTPILTFSAIISILHNP